MRRLAEASALLKLNATQTAEFLSLIGDGAAIPQGGTTPIPRGATVVPVPKGGGTVPRGAPAVAIPAGGGDAVAGWREEVCVHVLSDSDVRELLASVVDR